MRAHEKLHRLRAIEQEARNLLRVADTLAPSDPRLHSISKGIERYNRVATADLQIPAWQLESEDHYYEGEYRGTNVPTNGDNLLHIAETLIAVVDLIQTEQDRVTHNDYSLEKREQGKWNAKLIAGIAVPIVVALLYLAGVLLKSDSDEKKPTKPDKPVQAVWERLDSGLRPSQSKQEYSFEKGSYSMVPSREVASLAKSDEMVAIGLGSVQQNIALGKYSVALIDLKALYRDQKISEPVYERNLGLISHYLGNTQDAVRHYRKASVASPNEVAWREDLAVVLYYNGEVDAARDEFGAALAHRQNRDWFSSSTAETASNLASCLFAIIERDGAGQLREKAASLYWQSFAIYSVIERDQAFNLFGVLTNLASLHQREQDEKQSLILGLEALKWYKRIPGEAQDPRDLSNLSNTLGLAYLVQGDFTRSKERLKEALDLRMTHYPKNHPMIAQSLMNLGDYYVELFDVKGDATALDVGIDHYVEAIGMYEAGNARGLPDYANALDSLESARNRK